MDFVVNSVSHALKQTRKKIWSKTNEFKTQRTQKSEPKYVPPELGTLSSHAALAGEKKRKWISKNVNPNLAGDGGEKIHWRKSSDIHRRSIR